MSSSMFRRRSRARVRRHRAQWRWISAVPLTRCANPACGELTPKHQACPACGRYQGRQVLPPRES